MHEKFVTYQKDENKGSFWVICDLQRILNEKKLTWTTIYLQSDNTKRQIDVMCLTRPPMISSGIVLYIWESMHVVIAFTSKDFFSNLSINPWRQFDVLSFHLVIEGSSPKVYVYRGVQTKMADFLYFDIFYSSILISSKMGSFVGQLFEPLIW